MEVKMKKYIIFMIVTVLFSAMIFSQSVSISFLKIEGNTSLATSLITSKLSNAVQIGQPLNSDALYTALQALYNTGYFSYIEPKIQYSPIGPGLVIILTENPVLKSVDVKVNGPDLIGMDKIRGAITVEASKILNLVDLKTSFQNVMQLYTNAGYISNMISLETNITQSGNKIIIPSNNLVITINEYAIWNLKMTGDYGNLTPQQIIQNTGLFTMKGFESMNPLMKLFSNANDAYPKFSQMQDFQSKLFQMGYFSPETSLNFAPATDVSSNFKDPAVDLVVNAKLMKVVKSGLPIDNYFFSGVSEVDPFALAKYAGITAPATTNNFEQLVQLAKIRDYYQKKGYLLTSANVEYYKYQSSNDGFIDYKVIERHIGKIEITGNTKTKSYLIRRELAFHVGDPVTIQSIIQSYNNLNNTGFFTNVSITPTFPSTDSTTVNMVVTITENNKPRQIGGSLTIAQPQSGQPWYSGIYASGNLGLVDWNGYGESLTSQINLGLNPNANITYGVIFPFDLPMNFNTSLYYSTLNPFVTVNGQNIYYDESEYGLSASIGYQPNVYTSYNLGMNYYYFNNTQGSTPIAPSYLSPATGTCRQVNLSWNYTNVDNTLLSMSGVNFSLGGSYAGFGGQKNFAQGTFMVSGYLPILPQLSIGGRVLVGDGYGTNFDVGGPTTVRGWNPVAGTQEFVSNLDLRYEPPSSSSIPMMLSAFYDFGGAGNQLFAYGNVENAFMNSIGVGISLNVPYLGVLRFDFPFKVVNSTLQYGGITFGVGEMF
jgi:outer membrane protein insertion porin family|uniref:POTRA domain-containing protein n=1 Tax=Mesoaciditoga lauensis TaxID=1495039 RepID=A0A7V3VSE4_9BACT